MTQEYVCGYTTTRNIKLCNTWNLLEYTESLCKQQLKLQCQPFTSLYPLIYCTFY